MRTGTVIRIKYNAHNYPEIDGDKWVYTYFELKDGQFEIPIKDEGYTYKFTGYHFVCLGSDYFHGQANHIRGTEILDDEYEIAQVIPPNLIQ